MMKNDDINIEPWLKAGRIVANPPVGEDIVITGISGCFPESNNISEFRDNLANKADMVTYDRRRWDAVHPEIPKRAGKIWNVEKFDAGFFGVHQHQCNAIDPLCRILLEKAFECVLDAGLNPKDLEGSHTGIYVGACASESEKYWLYDNQEAQAFAITGCHRSMLAARVAYALKLQGPAFVMDTACSSSFFAFEHAYRAIREGRCERAIVAGANLCLHPYVTLQFSRLGVLSPDGACKCFDDGANGYTRSEAICAILLQKSQEAKRIYAHVVHSKVNADGYKEQGITYPSGDIQKNLIKEVYMECEINPNEICFMEAHGTGTKVGDPEELKAIDDIFLSNRDGPLFIGSVKSNIGHTEPTSGLCSISKVILSYEGGKILPNMNYQRPRKGIKSLADGSLIVVTENTNWPDDNGLVGINSFGFGGANCHTILRWNQKTKNSSDIQTTNKLPLLVAISGRTSEAVQTILDDLKLQYHDSEYVRLFHEIFRLHISGHDYRGFQYINPNKPEDNFLEDIKWVPNQKPELIFCFGGIDNFWVLKAQDLLQIQQFRSSINKMHDILLNLGVNLAEILTNHQENNRIHQALSTLCCQIGLVDVLKDLGIVPDKYLGTSIGEITCAYLEGFMTLQQALEFAYSAVLQNNLDEIRLWKAFSAEGSGRLRSKKWMIAEKIENKACIIKFGSVKLSTGKNNLEIIELVSDGENIVNQFFLSLGKLYLSGFTLNLHVLYPDVPFPVSRGTPMISPLIKWDHNRDWYVTKYRAQDIIKTGFIYMALDLKDEYWKYLSGHVADGRNLFPATGYLLLAWDVLGMITGKMPTNMTVAFENVKFLHATNIPSKGTLFFTVMVQRGTGNFEIVEGGVAIVTGRIKDLHNKCEKLQLPTPPKSSIMLGQKQIYTELKLRGYNYRGAFKGMKNVDLSCSNGTIEWTGNWVAFLDNMLQMQILQIDTRSLYVPTGIKSIIIDAPQHSKLNDEGIKEIAVYAHKDLDLIRSGGVEMRGILANVINRKKVAEPVLEKYVFVPNEAQLELVTSARVIMQVALENYALGKLKVIELHAEQQNIEDCTLITPFIRQALDDFPLIEADIRVFTSATMDLPPSQRIIVEDKSLSQETDCYLVILEETKISANWLLKIEKSLRPEGYLLVKSPEIQDLQGFNLLLNHDTPLGQLLLYRRKRAEFTKEVFLEYDETGTCLTKLKELVATNDGQIVLYTNQRTNGLLGFTNCLRREPSGNTTRCLIVDDDPEINCQLDKYKAQLAKGLAINIRKHGKWGTYRHLSLEDAPKVQSEHAYVNVTVRGDLASLSWIQGPISNQDDHLVHVHYGAVNFRDVMTASGRVSVDAITNDRLEQECVQGFEYSGIDSQGRRVMGMLSSGALATIVVSDPNMVLVIPDNWSMEDAVTVPVVYGTVLFAFFMRAGGLKPGQSVLIHSGTGGVGQAAITIALFYKCNVYVTVGTPEKKKYLLQKFPQLLEANVGHSRDISFEHLILHRTGNRGVDIILNSLAEEKLQASLRCLADNGHFLEIGKFDLALDSNLDASIFQRGISFHGIMLDGLFKSSPAVKRKLMNLLQTFIDAGAVIPLERTVFEREDLEKAFRFMATGKHVGKVVIKVRNDENDFPKATFPAIPKYYCPTGNSCLVIGGLGGFGLELCDWLVLRGCKHLVITSRNGPKNGYQHLRLETWKTYGATVTILKEDLYSHESCARVLATVPNLDAVFNLAVVLHDGLLENQTVDQLQEVLQSKATTTKYLDQLTRTMCPSLRYFIAFSSVSCGRGNIGQINYGMANGIIEKIMEQRKDDQLPALAIQWGSIADVGLAAELINDDTHERPIGGTLPQRISNCLEVLDLFIAQQDAVVSSMVVAAKRGGLCLAGNMVDTVVNILGLRDLKTVSLHSSLPELGMDSMMAVEIKQTLEREYEVFLTPHDIRTLTFAGLQELQGDKSSKDEPADTKIKEDQQSNKRNNVKLLLRFINDEDCSKLSVVPLKSLKPRSPVKAFLLPGVEGFASILETLCAKLKVQTIGLQFCYDNPPDTLQQMAELLVPHILPHLHQQEPFHIIAYSFGCTVAVELAILLEKQFGHRGQLILIDGAHDMMLKLTHQQANVNSAPEFETSILCNIFTIYMPLDLVDTYREELMQMKSYEERVNFVQSKSPEAQYSKEYIKKVCIAFYKRVKAVVDYAKTDFKLKSNIYLLKPIRLSVLDLEEDYDLKSFMETGSGPVDVRIFDGDHYSILENDELANEINQILCQKQDTKPICVKESGTIEEKVAESRHNTIIR